MNSPNLVKISDSGGNLVLILQEWVLLVELNLLSWVLILTMVHPRVVNLLGLLHEGSDTVNRLVVDWLSFEGRLVDGHEVEDVVVNIIVLSFVDENLILELLDLDIPRVV